MINLKEIIHFVKYVDSFYNDVDGIYKIATSDQIEDACIQFVTNAIEKKTELHYDSIDRELVRQILEPSYSMFIPA